MTLSSNPVIGGLSSTNEYPTGDPKEFQKLYERYYPDFVEEAGQLLMDKNAAPDLVKHSFIKLWLKCADLNESKYFAFLRVSVNLHCYNYNEGKNYSAEQQAILDEIISAPVGDVKDRQSIYTAIRSTSSEQKAQACQAFEKLYVRRLSLPVIAADMGHSIEETQQLLDLAYHTLHLILSFNSL